jgi:hypothetical protein
MSRRRLDDAGRTIVLGELRDAGNEYSEPQTTDGHTIKTSRHNRHILSNPRRKT